MRSQYSDEVRAAVVAELLAGESPAVVAVRFAVPVATVRSWKSRLLPGLSSPGSAPGAAAGVRERIGELVLAYLSQALESLREQVRVFGDAEWIKRQAAGDIAILHGIVLDKTIRILEAIGDDSGSDAGATGGEAAV